MKGQRILEDIACEAILQLRSSALKQIGKSENARSSKCEIRGIPVTDLLGHWIPWLERYVLHKGKQLVLSSDHRWTPPYIDDYRTYAKALGKILGVPFAVEYHHGEVKYEYIVITWGDGKDDNEGDE